MDRSKLQFTEQVNNHPSATNFPDDINAYSAKEPKHKVIIGPCNNLPLKVHHSPMLLQPKENDKRTAIVNLSHPYDNSINDCISNEIYGKVEFNLKYPTVEGKYIP